MTELELKQVAVLFVMYGAYYHKTLPDEVLKMYAEDLSDFSLEQVKEAMERYRKNPRNRQMPLPASIRDLISPQVDPEHAAREIAARVTGAVSKFGWTRLADAREYIGEVGWQIVDRQGGWQYLCERLGVLIDMSTFQAQIREQAKSMLLYSPEAMQAAISGREQPKELAKANVSEILGLVGLKPKEVPGRGVE